MLLFLCLLLWDSHGFTVTDVTGMSSDITTVLSTWNVERSSFGLPPLTWNPSAQSVASTVASQCTKSLNFIWPSGMSYAFSLYTCDGTGYPLSSISQVPPAYQCVSNAESCSGSRCGGYRAVIAKGAVSIGCAVSRCDFGSGTNLCGVVSPSSSSVMVCFVSAGPKSMPTPSAGLCKPALPPLSTSTPSSTPRPTSTPPPSTPSSTPRPTSTPPSTPSSTPRPTSTPPSTPSSTPRPTSTPPSTPSSTPRPPSTPASTPPPSTPSSTPRPTPSPTPSNPPSSCVVPSTMTAVLAAHQTERAKFGIPNLIWDCKLAQVAQNYANSCPGLSHSTTATSAYGTGEYVGENLAVASGMDPTASGWVGEKSSWTCSTNACSGVCGHYTQMIWAQTTRVGCGLKKGCTSGGWPNILVCNYAKGGNYVGVSPLDYGNGTKSKCPASYAIADGTAQSFGNGASGVSLPVGSFVGIIIGTVFFSMLFTFVIIILVSKFRRSQEEIH
eukprot:TRINITY_DN8825_c0_g1_i2.p1 TRINITY_DN8825_c0_g1~~TRINITY_DN8825_c0_g1_i2.p1  ORF type:complete len:497 (-),score=121.45 TRINITY_DN8825_c0_g1_i2:68-1558(-)